MTSSLVGSEMCIRDRRSMAMMEEDANGDFSFKDASGLTDDINQAMATAPVSYTHLTLPTICSV
eukprot:7181343-Prorocentrum_lima.AAC.1